MASAVQGRAVRVAGRSPPPRPPSLLLLHLTAERRADGLPQRLVDQLARRLLLHVELLQRAARRRA
eukprot:CAMPEP_0179346354 /NCGR_PEP_ID=MMETSP0797-20121207/72525_1 /TAXON_ID=47934 /ORGANISM="Dinophysis acuminata, Strain DAEP01" /LENGTH=65 /DNA_ID=CAMNT_0021060889 /DNA_START=1 /DNA_END=194 /DNA_ORIENTATION=+